MPARPPHTHRTQGGCAIEMAGRERCKGAQTGWPWRRQQGERREELEGWMEGWRTRGWPGDVGADQFSLPVYQSRPLTLSVSADDTLSMARHPFPGQELGEGKVCVRVCAFMHLLASAFLSVHVRVPICMCHPTGLPALSYWFCQTLPSQERLGKELRRVQIPVKAPTGKKANPAPLLSPLFSQACQPRWQQHPGSRALSMHNALEASSPLLSDRPSASLCLPAHSNSLHTNQIRHIRMSRHTHTEMY